MGLFDEIKDKLAGRLGRAAGAPATQPSATPAPQRRPQRAAIDDEGVEQSSAPAATQPTVHDRVQQVQEPVADAPATDETTTPMPASEASTATTDQAPAARPRRTYTVKPGDKLSTIAEQFGVDRMEIARANGVKNPDLIYPGQVFTIPE